MGVLNKLVGLRINGIFLNADHTRVIFRTTCGQNISYYTAGDCCNTVYINHFQGKDVVGEGNTFDLIRGALVLSTEEKEWVQIDNDEQDEDSWHDECVEDGFFTIKTDRGYIDFEVRNEHNGYYSGHLEEDNNYMKEEEFFPLEDF